MAATAATAAAGVDAGAKSRNPNSGNTDTNEQSEWQKHQGEEAQHYRSGEEGVQHTSNTWNYLEESQQHQGKLCSQSPT